MSRQAQNAHETITEAEFDELLEQQSQYDTKKWTDLEIKKIYTITSYRTVDTSNGESLVLTLKDNGDVWCPAHLAKKIEGKEPPFYIRPLGLKPCKNNKKISIMRMIWCFQRKETITCIKIM